MAFDKIPKVVAVYLPKRYVGRGGTRCNTCRDFIKSGSMCVILEEPKVSGPKGTCTQFIKGSAPQWASSLKLVSKKVVGYIEGDDVPTYCGRCEYYADPSIHQAECAKVGDHEGDLVDWGGCCNSYEARDSHDQADEEDS